MLPAQPQGSEKSFSAASGLRLACWARRASPYEFVGPGPRGRMSSEACLALRFVGAGHAQPTTLFNPVFRGDRVERLRCGLLEGSRNIGAVDIELDRVGNV